MNEIQEKLNLLGWSVDTLLKHLDTVYKRRLRDKKRHREYFLRNKKKIYEYHKIYREKHPEYVRGKRKRGKKKDE